MKEKGFPLTPKTFACLEAHAAQPASRAKPNHYSQETRGRIEMPIDEVGEGSLPAACMVVFCLMRTGTAIDCNLFRPIGWGQRAELRVTC